MEIKNLLLYLPPRYTILSTELSQLFKKIKKARFVNPNSRVLRLVKQADPNIASSLFPRLLGHNP
jgi:hypothetical protein